jgi:sodium/potassium/calcium exchanger 6
LFRSALEMFSVKLGLPPRFAGVTLLALGNGAADVSATVSAITSDQENGYKLALGALTGAAMVIGCVVSALVVLVAGGVPCRGALVRDVLALLVAVLVVWNQLAVGSIGPEAVSLFLSLYAMFVMLVLAADIYHRAVVLPRLAAAAQERERERQLEEQERMHGVSPLNSDDPQLQQQQSQRPPNQQQQAGATPKRNPDGLLSMLTAFSNYDQNDPSTEGWGVESDDLAQDRPIVLHGTHGIMHGDGHLASPAGVTEEHYSMLQDDACVTPGAMGVPATNWVGAFYDGRNEIIQHASSVWEDIVWNGDVNVVSKFLLLCELPFTTLRKLTVPIPCEGFYVRAMVALSVAISPVWLIYYLWNMHGINLLDDGGWFYFLVLWSLFVFGAALILRYAPGGEGDMSLHLATPIALYGFAIAATWIDTIADNLVNLLDFVGIILKIPAPIVGLTILAWGNSMGDLSANMTMARKGLANMAMTACFAGPLFNILVGLGLGFSSLAAQTGKVEAAVSLSPSVVTGFLFIIVNTGTIIFTGLLLGQGKIPVKYGYIALTLYTIYLVTSISLQYSKYGDN